MLPSLVSPYTTRVGTQILLTDLHYGIGAALFHPELITQAGRWPSSAPSANTMQISQSPWPVQPRGPGRCSKPSDS